MHFFLTWKRILGSWCWPSHQKGNVLIDSAEPRDTPSRVLSPRVYQQSNSNGVVEREMLEVKLFLLPLIVPEKIFTISCTQFSRMVQHAVNERLLKSVPIFKLTKNSMRSVIQINVYMPWITKCSERISIK